MSGFLRGPDPVEDGLHLAWCEDLAGVFVAGGEEFVAEHVVAADDGHEVVDGDAWGAVGEVEESEFFLGVGAEFCFHGVFFLTANFANFTNGAGAG